MPFAEILRLARFGVVGLTAAAVHYATVVVLVEGLGIAPLHANVGGFAVAFWCSFLGHRHWTFGDQRGVGHASSFFRFLGAAVLGFLLNQALFALLLAHTRMPYFVSLAIVVFAVAVVTYILSKLWAFRQ